MSKKIKDINDLWESYKNNVISKNAGKIQIRETKQAFCAGLFVVAEKIKEIVCSPEFSDDQGVDEMEKLFEDIINFKEKYTENEFKEF